MANALYDLGRQGFLDGSIDWDTNTIRAALVRGYTANLTTHNDVDDVTGAGGTLVQTQVLGTKTVTSGVADAGDVTFTAVPVGTAIQHVLIYQDTGSTATSRLIALIDTTTGVVLPVTPNGGDIIIQWDAGANKIFKL